jgi:hypothetical protein
MWSRRSLDSAVVPCPSCGREVELFSDEPSRRCRCGRLIVQETPPSCADWCPAAPECLGSSLDAEEVRRRGARLRDDPHAKQYVDRICRQLRESYGSASD